MQLRHFKTITDALRQAKVAEFIADAFPSLSQDFPYWENLVFPVVFCPISRFVPDDLSVDFPGLDR